MDDNHYILFVYGSMNVGFTMYISSLLPGFILDCHLWCAVLLIAVKHISGLENNGYYCLGVMNCGPAEMPSKLEEIKAPGYLPISQKRLVKVMKMHLAGSQQSDEPRRNQALVLKFTPLSHHWAI